MERYYAKKKLRAQLKVDRSEISMKRSLRYQKTLAQFLSESELCGDYVVCYSPLVGEVDVAGLADVFNCALTRIAEKCQLTIHEFASESELSSYGFVQPVVGAPGVDRKNVAAVLVPGLAFDRNGSRLGFGQGYYDRFLAKFGSGVLKIGVVTALIDAIPVESHDMAMTHLAFENEVRATPM